jgi:hypothetical protein
MLDDEAMRSFFTGLMPPHLLAAQFAEQKYVVWRGCLSDPELTSLYRYTLRRHESGTMGSDPRSPGAAAAPGDVFIDGLLLDLLPMAEQVTRCRLFPTYSYFRVYKRGDLLVKHRDRPSCEFSVTLCLGYDAARPWPLLIQGPTGVTSIELEPGDGLFYRGTECEHWREPMEGERMAQAFLHYVDQNGPYAEWKYDKRPAIPFHRPREGP